MAYDPNNPQATAADVEPVALLDPATGQPIAPTATFSFAEWCALDPALADADKAAFDTHYAALAASEKDAAVAQAEHSVATSAFTRFYGPSSEQKMDLATLKLRMESMAKSLEANPPAPPPPPPPETPAAE